MPTALPRPGDLLRIRDTRWRVLRCTAYDDASVVHVDGCGRENTGVRTHFLLPFEPVEALPASLTPVVVRPRRWRRRARTILALASPAYSALATLGSASLSILPFQLEPVLAVTRGLAARLLIADAVGLGKTVQAALVVAEVLRREAAGGHVLIVCPAGLREQWQQELRTRFTLDATVLDSAALAQVSVHTASSPWTAHPIVITSIDYVKRPEVMRALEALLWDVVVFDEAHALTGWSDRHAAAAALAARSRTVVLLTATPHSGDDDGFARLTAIGDIDGGFPLCVFRRTRLDAGLPLARRTHWLRVRPTPAERQMHDALLAYTRRVWAAPSASGARLAMAVLTKRACSGAGALVRSLERRLALLGSSPDDEVQLSFSFLTQVEDDEPVAQLAAPGLRDRAQEQRLLQSLLEIARAAAQQESKLRRLANLLRRVRQPAIVFTEYRDTLMRLASAMAGHGPVLLHGGMSSGERRAIVRQFTEGNATLLLATDAASEGLNLHLRCRLVVNLDLPWTPLRLEQRTGRVDRIGQLQRVHVIHLVAEATAEESTVAVLCRRQQNAELAMEALGDAALTEEAVLRSIVEGGDTGTKGLHAIALHVLPKGTHAIDLREASIAEAGRLASVRRLGGGSAGVPSLRPPVAVIRRRGELAAAFWVFTLGYVDNRGRPVWEALIGLHAAVTGRIPRSAAALRRWLERSLPTVLESARREHHRGLQTLVRGLEIPLALSLRREEAILQALRGEHARMATRLVQPGLFDRRSDRAARAQQQVVEEALSRGRERLADLHARRRPTALGVDLAFAVVLG